MDSAQSNFLNIPDIHQYCVAIGDDSRVYDIPEKKGGMKGYLLKRYVLGNPPLTLSELQAYHCIHADLHNRGDREVRFSDLNSGLILEDDENILCLDKKQRRVHGARVRVLDLGYRVGTDTNGTVYSWVPYVHGKNLESLRWYAGNRWPIISAIGDAVAHILNSYNPVIGDVDGRLLVGQNIMVTGVRAGIVDVTVTDIGAYIPSALRALKK